MLDLDVKEIEKKLDVIWPLNKNHLIDNNSARAQDILKFNPLLQGVIENWLNTGKETDFEHEGLSIFEIMKRLHSTFYWALDIMNYYITDSKEWQEYTRQNLESLYRMNDIVEWE